MDIKKENDNVQNNKKLIVKKIFIVLVIILLIAIIIITNFDEIEDFIDDIRDGFDNSTNNDTNQQIITVKDNKERINIKKSDSSIIKYEKYDNGLVSFDCPVGWKVEVAPVDYIHYCFKVYNPDNPDYIFLFGLKQEGSLKSEKARQVYASLYPDAIFAKLAAIDPQTTEGFYKVWNENSNYNNTSLGINFFPELNNFKVIDNLGKDVIGGDILRATFTSESGKSCQGLFTASVKAIGEYYINENMFNLFSPKVDVSPLNIYNIILMSTPEDDFINWQNVLNHCLSTIQFSNTFMNGFNSQEDAVLKTVQSNQKVYDQISDMIMDSWEKRNNSYDIISQKQSDSTLGYERIYDIETGDVYKAYNGFMDDYTGDRYQAVTDDMYTKSISGYIEK